MTESLAAASTIPRNSVSLMNGPCSKSLPFTIRFVMRMSRLDAIRSGQNAANADTNGAVAVAPRTEYNTA